MSIEVSSSASLFVHQVVKVKIESSIQISWMEEMDKIKHDAHVIPKTSYHLV